MKLVSSLLGTVALFLVTLVLIKPFECNQTFETDIQNVSKSDGAGDNCVKCDTDPSTRK